MNIFIAKKDDFFYIFNLLGNKIHKSKFAFIRYEFKSFIVSYNECPKKSSYPWYDFLNLGLISYKGEKLLDFVYQNIYFFEKMNNKYILVKQKNKYGILNEKLNIIVDIEWDFINIMNYNYFYVSKKNKIGILDLNGKTIQLPMYDEILSSNKNFIYAKINCTWYLLNVMKKTKIKLIYKTLVEEYNYYKISYNGYWGLLNYDGSSFLKTIFEKIEITLNYSNRSVLIKLKYDGKTGLMNTNKFLIFNPGWSENFIKNYFKV